MILTQTQLNWRRLHSLVDKATKLQKEIMAINKELLTSPSDMPDETFERHARLTLEVAILVNLNEKIWNTLGANKFLISSRTDNKKYYSQN